MILKDIYKRIKKNDTIVIARHIGADPDSLASSIGLKEIILNTFPNKKVYVVGNPASRFRFFGSLDKVSINNALLIVVDTPDKKRIDGIDITRYKEIIKIDHHPFIEEYGNIEWIDDGASSASQMIVELTNRTRLKMNKSAAEKLFLGIVSDTNRFLYPYTSVKTLKLATQLIEDFNLDFPNLYPNIYNRSMKEIRFMGYLSLNMVITPNKLGYIKLTDEILKEYDVDCSTAGNLIENYSNIDELLVWAFFSVDSTNNIIKGSMRSRGPVINTTASKYNGGGHIYACGAKLNDFDEVDALINDLDIVCKEFNERI